MSSVQIPNLTPAIALNGTEQMEAVQAGVSVQITTAQLMQLIYMTVYTVATLPSAATAGVGARAFVTNATATTFASVVAGGGANKVPVFSDGSAWRIG